MFEATVKEHAFDGYQAIQQRRILVLRTIPVVREQAVDLITYQDGRLRGYIPLEKIQQVVSSYYKNMRLNEYLEKMRVRLYTEAAYKHADSFPEIYLASELHQALQDRPNRLANFQSEGAYDVFKIYGLILAGIKRDFDRKNRPTQ